MTFAVPRRRQRVDREHLIAGREQRLHPRAAVGLDPDHHLIRFGVDRQMLSQQRVQLPDPRDTLRQPATDQPAPGLVLDLHIVMGLSPVVPDEQQQRSSSLDPAPAV
jgi:hypothetical protein